MNRPFGMDIKIDDIHKFVIFIHEITTIVTILYIRLETLSYATRFDHYCLFDAILSNFAIASGKIETLS